MKPILFNGEMVKAILDDRKTVTRRIIKPISKKACGFSICSRNDGKGNFIFEDVYDTDDNERMFDSPQSRIRVGDVLYVRETFYYEEHMHDLTAGEPDLPNGLYSHRFIYRASNPDYPVNVGVGKGKWTPSLHMPKEAARIFLKVTDVRVERLQDMKIDDVIKEGAYPLDAHYYGSSRTQLAFDLWIDLWNSTIKKPDLDQYGWEANPWVWVIEFERCEKEAEEGK